MKGKLLIALLAILLVLPGCAKTKTVTCDGCGKQQQIDAGSKMDDSWIIYCKECEERLFGEDGVVS